MQPQAMPGIYFEKFKKSVSAAEVGEAGWGLDAPK